MSWCNNSGAGNFLTTAYKHIFGSLSGDCRKWLVMESFGSKLETNVSKNSMKKKETL